MLQSTAFVISYRSNRMCISASQEDANMFLPKVDSERVVTR